MESLLESGGEGEGEALCSCHAGGSLTVLSDVQRAYEERMEVIEKVGGSKKEQLQVEALRSWVSDLAGQNELLARTVYELEREATARLLRERERHNEKKRPCVTSRELSGKNDALLKENLAKEREIRRLNRDVQTYEQTILSMRSEIPNYRAAECAKKDAEVMVCMGCTQDECGGRRAGAAGAGGVLPRGEADELQEKMRNMAHTLKGSGTQVVALRRVNVAMSEELHALRRVCAALDEQCRAAAPRLAFKDDIIREMRRQLKQAKAKLKGSASADADGRSECGGQPGAVGSRSMEVVVARAPLRRPPAPPPAPAPRAHYPAPLHPDSDSPRFDGSGDDCGSFKDD